MKQRLPCALHWSKHICNQAVGNRYALIFQCMESLVAVENQSLVILWAANFAHCPIDESDTVGEWYARPVDYISIRLKMGRIQPRLVQVLQEMTMSRMQEVHNSVKDC